MPGDFCGFKDYVPYTLKDRPFSEDFSFSREEVRALLAYYGYEDQLDSLCDLYGAQMTGDADIVIPWHVMRYLAIDCGEF